MKPSFEFFKKVYKMINLVRNIISKGNFISDYYE